MFCAHFFAKCILLVCQFRLFYQPFLRLLQVPVPLLCRRLKVHCTFKCFRPGKSDGKREKTPEKSPMWHSCKQTKKRSRKKNMGKRETDRSSECNLHQLFAMFQFLCTHRQLLVCIFTIFTIFHAQWGYLGTLSSFGLNASRRRKKGMALLFFLIKLKETLSLKGNWYFEIKISQLNYHSDDYCKLLLSGLTCSSYCICNT